MLPPVWSKGCCMRKPANLPKVSKLLAGLCFHFAAAALIVAGWVNFPLLSSLLQVLNA